MAKQNLSLSGLSPQTRAILLSAHIDTKEKLEYAEPLTLLKLPGFGLGRLDEVNSFLLRPSNKMQIKIRNAIRCLTENGYEIEKPIKADKTEVIEVAFKFIGGCEGVLSYQNDLIMLHSDFISAQWGPNFVGVEVCSFNTEDSVKLAFHPTNSDAFQNYQSFYIHKEHEDELLKFFRLLGFPCPQHSTLKKFKEQK